jgi:hypothetical protein
MTGEEPHEKDDHGDHQDCNRVNHSSNISGGISPSTLPPHSNCLIILSGIRIVI